MNRLFILLFFFITFDASSQKKDLGLQFLLNEQDIEGGMLFFDLEENDYYTNSKRLTRGSSSPGTTFHLFNTLMFYHLGIVKDSSFMLEWDGELNYFNDYEIPEWNKDNTLGEAFRNGNDWFFKELSQDIEHKLYRKFVKKSKYGRMIAMMSENPDFWNGGSGKVRIKMKDQIKFLRRIYQSKLPFKKKHVDLVKQLMLEKSTEDYKLYGKVGLSKQRYLFSDRGNDKGWYLGYVETKNNTYFFISYISKSFDDDREDFLELRKQIVYKSLKHLFNIDIE